MGRDGAIKRFLATRRSPCTVLALQEHRLLECAIAEASQSMANAGWQMGFAAAQYTGERAGGEASDAKHSSAGVCVAAPTSVGMEQAFGEQDWDVSMPSQPGRVAMAWCDILKGVVVISAYFWCSEGWSDRNIALMQHIACKVAQLHVPWILAADVNMEPEVFGQGYWFAALQGVIVAPDGVLGTCATGEQHRKYDYFVVHPELEKCIESVATMHDYPSSPHKPVKLTLRLVPNTYQQRIQCKPRPLPVHHPVGCAPPPKVWPCMPTSLGTEEEATSLWKTLITTAEEEIIDVHGVTGEEAEKMSVAAQLLKLRC